MKRNLIVAWVLLGLVGCSGVNLPFPDIPGAPGAPAGHPGFDSWRYPGDDVMSDWLQSSPYRWVGFYLASPCHRDASFSGKRDWLTRRGWGIAVLYVGQQTFDGQEPAEVTESTLCSSALLTPQQGVIDGRDAIAKTTAEGFPAGTIIYLDIERMARINPEMVAYYESWIRTVVEDGRFAVGTYAHVENAAALYNVAQTLAQRSGITRSIPFWIAGGTGFSLDAAPQAVGATYARIWQGALDVQRTWGGHTLQIDENVATTRSPSMPTAP